MKFFKFSIALMCALSYPTQAQIKTGTLIVIYFSQEKAVIAADSLSITKHLQGLGDSEYRCKIFALDEKTLFISSNFGGYKKDRPEDPVPEWSPNDEAQKLYDASPKAPLEQLAKRWIDSAVNWINNGVQYPLFRQRIEAAARGNFDSQGRGTLMPAYFFSSETAEVQGFEIRIGYDFSNSFAPAFGAFLPTKCDTPIGPYCAIGRPDQIFDFFHLSSDRAKADAKEWESQRHSRQGDEEALKAQHLVELGIKYDRSGTIGGPVDVAILPRNGTVKWFANPNCKCR